MRDGASVCGIEWLHPILGIGQAVLLPKPLSLPSKATAYISGRRIFVEQNLGDVIGVWDS